MKTFFVVFLLALVLSLLTTRIMVWLGWRLKILDVAWGRKIHRGNVPRLGGVAVAVSFFLPIAALLFWDNSLSGLLWQRTGQMAALFFGAILATMLGLADDVKHVRARYKFLGQIAIAAGAWLLGVRIELVHLPFLGDLDLSYLSLPFTILWIVGLMNAINLVDGVDGLCAGVVLIASIAIFAVAWAGNAVLVSLFAASLAGSLLGFLRYNFNPAAIFLGDSGSYFLGYVLAVVSIIGAQKATTAVALLSPMLAFGLPIIDTVLAIARRALGGRPIFAPDRGHIHHRLLDSGASQRRTVLILYVVSAVFALAGIIVVLGQEWAAGFALTTVVLLVVFLIRQMGLWRLPSPSHSDALPPLLGETLGRHIPAFHRRLVLARSLSEFPDALARFCGKAGLERLDVTLNLGPPAPIEWSVRPAPGFVTPPSSLPLSEATIEIRDDDRVIGKLHATWRSEMEGLRAAARTMFMLMGDMIAAEAGRFANPPRNPSRDV